MSLQKLRSRQRLMSSLSQHGKKNKVEVATKSSVAKEIDVAIEYLGRDKRKVQKSYEVATTEQSHEIPDVAA